MDCERIQQNMCWWTRTNNDAVDDWTITTNTAAASHPVDNIQSEQATLTWRTPDGTGAPWIQGQSLTGIDLAGLWGFVVHNHNFLAVNSVDIQLDMWDSFVGGIQLYNVAFPSRLPTGSLVDMISRKSRAVYSTEAIASTVKRWRLTFLATSDPIPYYEIGRVFLGNPFQPSIAFGDNECLFFANDQTQVKRSFGKNGFKNVPPFSRNLDIAAPATISNEDFLDWINLLYVNGQGQNVFADPFPVVDELTIVAPTLAEGNRNFFYQMYGTVKNSLKIGTWQNHYMASGRINVFEEL